MTIFGIETSPEMVMGFCTAFFILIIASSLLSFINFNHNRVKRFRFYASMWCVSIVGLVLFSANVESKGDNHAKQATVVIQAHSEA